jgi:hypothetical protein
VSAPVPPELAELTLRLEAAEGQLAGLSGLVDTLRADVAALAGPGHPLPYEPEPSPRVWEMDEDQRAELVARLAQWVSEIYVPCYGHEAARLPACWREHDYCLLMLDWLAEFWQLLYSPDRRPAAAVAGQADWQTRWLHAAANGMEAEAARCGHRGGAPGGTS